MKKLLVLTLALLALPAYAAETGPLAYKSLGTVTATSALNGSPTTGYMAVLGQWSGLRLDITATRVAYTDVGFTCVSSPNQSTDYIITETAAGGSTTQLHPVYTSSASVKFSVTLNVSSFEYVKCTFTGTSAGATDYVAVNATLTRGL